MKTLILSFLVMAFMPHLASAKEKLPPLNCEKAIPSQIVVMPEGPNGYVSQIVPMYRRVYQQVATEKSMYSGRCGKGYCWEAYEITVGKPSDYAVGTFQYTYHYEVAFVYRASEKSTPIIISSTTSRDGILASRFWGDGLLTATYTEDPAPILVEALEDLRSCDDMRVFVQELNDL